MTAAERIAELVVTLAGMRGAVFDGALLDLSGLDGAVADALIAAGTAPVSDRAALCTELARLADELDGLAAALARQHHADAQRRAAAAYGAGPAAPPHAAGTGS